MLKALRRNLYQFACFHLSHVQGILCLTGSTAKTTFYMAPFNLPQSFNIMPKSSALLKPSHCPHSTLWEIQHVPSPPCCENAILKGCNIALVWFQVFFDQNPKLCPTQTMVLYNGCRSTCCEPCLQEVKCGGPQADRRSCAGQHGARQSVPLGLKANALFPFAILAWLCPYIHFYRMISLLILRSLSHWSLHAIPSGPLFYSLAYPHTVDRQSVLEDPQARSQSQLPVTSPAPFAGPSLPFV